MSGDCPECPGALSWGGQDYVPHSDTFHQIQRRWLLKSLRNQLEHQKSLAEWLEYNEKHLLVGIRWRNGVYPGWQSEERWLLPVEWWDTTHPLREGDREFILRAIREHLTYLFENQHGVTVNQATWFHKIYDPRLTRLDDGRPVCGSSPPVKLVGPGGEEWIPGDCWCTVAPDHDGFCYCGPCSVRYGAPGWMARDN